MTNYSSLRGSRAFKNITLGLATTTAALVAVAPVSAAPILYNVSGTFTDGTILSGSFDFDGTQTGAAQFSNVNVCSSAQFCWNHVAYGPYDGGQNESVYFNGQPNAYIGDYIYLTFPKVTVNGTTAITGTTLNTNTFTYYYYSRQYLASGTITPAAAAVPEPAAWAMMILGMGAVGYAMRRRRKAVNRVSYAA